MARESAGLTTLNGRLITSRAGAMGLMQLMPSTWSDMRAHHALGNDPFDPRDNIIAGAAYLKEMFDRYGFPNLFAAYHAGPRRMDAALAGEIPLPEATITYLDSIVPSAEIGLSRAKNRAPYASKSGAESLFFVRTNHENRSADNANSSSDSPNLPRAERRLFVPLDLPAPKPSR